MEGKTVIIAGVVLFLLMAINIFIVTIGFVKDISEKEEEIQELQFVVDQLTLLNNEENN